MKSFYSPSRTNGPIHSKKPITKDLLVVGFTELVQCVGMFKSKQHKNSCQTCLRRDRKKQLKIRLTNELTKRWIQTNQLTIYRTTKLTDQRQTETQQDYVCSVLLFCSVFSFQPKSMSSPTIFRPTIRFTSYAVGWSVGRLGQVSGAVFVYIVCMNQINFFIEQINSFFSLLLFVVFSFFYS